MPQPPGTSTLGKYERLTQCVIQHTQCTHIMQPITSLDHTMHMCRFNAHTVYMYTNHISVNIIVVFIILSDQYNNNYYYLYSTTLFYNYFSLLMLLCNNYQV